MKTTELRTSSLIRIRGSASLQEAAHLMCDMSLGALGVNDNDHRFVGLITERDLMWALAQDKNASTTLVRDVVNDFPIVVYGSITAEEAAEKMMAGHVRHLVIRQPEGLRIVSMRDLLELFLTDAGSPASAHAVSASELHMMFGATQHPTTHP